MPPHDSGINACDQTTPLLSVVCAGGQSRRMGEDKATLVVDGRPLIASVVAASRGAGLETWVVGRERPVDWRDADVFFFSDDHPGEGPLGALLTAWRRAPERSVMLLACDTPDLTAAAVEWLAAAFAADPVAAVCGDLDGQDQPLFAVYSATTRAVAQRLFAEGVRSLRSLLEAVGAARVTVPPRLEAAVRGVNTPAELRRLRSGRRPSTRG